MNVFGEDVFAHAFLGTLIEILFDCVCLIWWIGWATFDVVFHVLIKSHSLYKMFLNILAFQFCRFMHSFSQYLYLVAIKPNPKKCDYQKRRVGDERVCSKMQDKYSGGYYLQLQQNQMSKPHIRFTYGQEEDPEFRSVESVHKGPLDLTNLYEAFTKPNYHEISFNDSKSEGQIKNLINTTVSHTEDLKQIKKIPSGPISSNVQTVQTNKNIVETGKSNVQGGKTIVETVKSTVQNGKNTVETVKNTTLNIVPEGGSTQYFPTDTSLPEQTYSKELNESQFKIKEQVKKSAVLKEAEQYPSKVQQNIQSNLKEVQQYPSKFQQSTQQISKEAQLYQQRIQQGAQSKIQQGVQGVDDLVLKAPSFKYTPATGGAMVAKKEYVPAEKTQKYLYSGIPEKSESDFVGCCGCFDRRPKTYNVAQKK